MSEDLDVKIGSKEESFWDSVKKKCEVSIDQCKHEIVIQEHILNLAEDKIKSENEKK